MSCNTIFHFYDKRKAPVTLRHGNATQQEKDEVKYKNKINFVNAKRNFETENNKIYVKEKAGVVPVITIDKGSQEI